jgi:hypothetical protein
MKQIDGFIMSDPAHVPEMDFLSKLPESKIVELDPYIEWNKEPSEAEYESGKYTYLGERKRRCNYNTAGIQ